MAIVNSINNKTDPYLVGIENPTGFEFSFLIGPTTRSYFDIVDSPDYILEVVKGSKRWKIYPEGYNTKDNERFLAYFSAAELNVTGDGSVEDVVFDSTVYNEELGRYSTSTGRFTALLDGKYAFNVSILFSQLNSAHTDAQVSLVTSNRTYKTCMCNIGKMGSSTATSQSNICSLNVLADLDDGDTAYVQVQVSGGTKVVDISTGGSGDPRTYFCGMLIC